jgi:hypothetical protein
MADKDAAVPGPTLAENGVISAAEAIFTKKLRQ